MTVFEDAREKGDEIICILLSSALSGTYQSAILAKNMADYEGIYVVDSKAASYMIKELTDYARQMIEQGMTGGTVTTVNICWI